MFEINYYGIGHKKSLPIIHWIRTWREKSTSNFEEGGPQTVWPPFATSAKTKWDVTAWLGLASVHLRHVVQKHNTGMLKLETWRKRQVDRRTQDLPFVLWGVHYLTFDWPSLLSSQPMPTVLGSTKIHHSTISHISSASNPSTQNLPFDLRW